MVKQKPHIIKRWLIICAASFCFLSAGKSQVPEVMDYQITGHKVRMEILPREREIICMDTVSFHILNRNAKSLMIELMPYLKEDGIWIKGDEAEYRRENHEIVIKEIPNDSLFDVVFSYRGVMNFKTDFSMLTSERAVLREEEVLPRGPKALVFNRFSMVVPKEWNAIAIGGLIKVDSLADSTCYVWESDLAIPMIGWFCAGKYLYEKKETGSPVSTYLFEEDSSQAGRLSSLADSVLGFYSKNFSPFRFPKLAIIEVENWVAGRYVLAIAVPSMIMVKKSAFDTDDNFNRYPAILPHEIAHQWWPATVFADENSLAFLSEGMCEYSAHLYGEWSQTMSLRDSLDKHPLLRPLLARVQKERDVPLQQKADLRSIPTQYLKANYVHNMLRRLIGDSLFFQLYKLYATRFGGKNASLGDFQKIVEELSGKNLAWFFDQWVKGKGMPRLKIYNVKSTPQDKGWITKGRIRIVGYNKFTTFVDVGLDSPSETLKTRVFLGVDSAGNYKNDVGFEVSSKEKPVIARLDPGGDILKYQKLPVRFGDLRDPNDGVMIVGTLKNSEHLLALAKKDAASMENSGWSFSIKTDTEFTLKDLQNDRVFLYGKPDENRVVADHEKKFPWNFSGDSVVINGEATFDSSLSLLQVIENPYIAQGLFCWIAPLTEKAEPELMPYDKSWVLVRGKEEIVSGTWEVKDEDVVVEIK